MIAASLSTRSERNSPCAAPSSPPPCGGFLYGWVQGLGGSGRTGDRVQVREARRGGSYLSSHDPRLYFGLGEWTKVDAVEIRWPGGAVQRIAGVAANQLLVVEEGP